MRISLSFADPISEAYRERLQKFLNTILAKGITENRPPDISFPGRNHGTFNEIYKLRCAYERRYGA